MSFLIQAKNTRHTKTGRNTIEVVLLVTDVSK